LKLTVPGIPDIYQGAELWDLSLVDPDNRRPVDYRARTALLQDITEALERNRRAVLDMLEAWRDGRVKLAVIAALLAYRRERPKLFAQGGYEPLIATGPRADQICAFVRRQEEDELVVTAARFPARCEEDCDWTGTEVPWPRGVAGQTHWEDLLCGRVFERCGDTVEVNAVLQEMPVAVFVPASGGLVRQSRYLQRCDGDGEEIAR